MSCFANCDGTMASTADDKTTEVVLSDALWDDLAVIDRAFSSTPDGAPAAAAAAAAEAAEEPASFRLLVEDLQAVAETVFFQY